MKKNDEILLKIDDMGNNGEGIGHVDGYALFVKDALPSETVRVRLTKLNKNYGFARLLEVEKLSASRMEPCCPSARACGGCTLQHLSYEGQLSYKEKKVRDCLARIGGVNLPEVEWLPILGMQEPWNYRNKAQFPVQSDKNGKPVAGFYAGRSHTVIPVTACAIQHPVINEVVEYVLDFMRSFDIPPYNEDRHSGLVRHIYVRRGYHTGQVMVCLVVNGTSLPHSEDLVACLKRVEGMTSICLNINREKTNVILGVQMIPLWGPLYIEDAIGGIRYRISPQSFYQVNPVQTQKLYETALSFADLKGHERVWDLYCGIGTISLFFAKTLREKALQSHLGETAGEVFGVEIVPEAVENARENARLNGIENVSFVCGAAENVVPDIVDKGAAGYSADVVVVDPPRKGCDAALLDTMVRMAPEKIVYVSCDPATLARDVKVLGEKGYRVEKVRACDMFPQGGHVETVCVLGNKNRKPDDYLKVELELDELDLTSAESKATYKEIQDYVLEKFGLKVSNLYISQIKNAIKKDCVRKCGIGVGVNYNLRKATRRMDCLQTDSTTAANPEKLVSQGMPKSEDSRQPQCPKEKEKAIRDALEHFGMV